MEDPAVATAGRKAEGGSLPAGEPDALELADLIDAPALQKLMDDFYAVARIPMSILDAQGRVLVGVGWQDICTRFHRAHPATARHCHASDTELAGGLAPGEFRLYKCRNHMWDMATPIVADGRHVGHVFSGQFFFDDETIDRELFRAQAREYGFDEAEYLAALDRVPRLSRAAVERGMAFFRGLADTLSRLGHSNAKLARLLAERERLAAERRAITESIADAVALADPNGRVFYHNPASLALHGYASMAEAMQSSEELVAQWELCDLAGRPVPFANWPMPRALRGEVFTGYELRVRRRDTGREFIGSYSGSLVRSAAGEPLCALLSVRDITAGKRAEEALRRSQEDLDRAQEVAKVGWWRLDTQRNVLTWSDENHRIFGVPQGTPLTYEAFLACVHPDDRDDVDARWQAGMRGAPYDVEHRIVVNGQVRWVREKAYLEFDTKRRLLGGFGITQDITERKQAEEALRRSAQFPEENPNPVLRVAADGTLLYANAPAWEWLATMGWLGDGPLPEAVRAFAADARAQECVVQGEIADPAGGTLWISGVRPPGEDYVNLYGRDITDRVRMEKVLREERLLLRQVLDTAPDMIFVKDGAGRFLLVNEGLARVYGTTVPDVVGRTDADFNPDAGQVAHFRRDDQEVITTRRAKRIAEEPVRHADGQVRWYSTIKIPLIGEDGTCTRLLGVATDVHERKQVEDALRRTTERYALLSEIAGTLLAAPDPQALVEDLCGRVMRHLDCDVFFNFLVEEGAARLRLNACAGTSAEAARQIECLDFGAAVCGCVARDGRRIVVEDIQHTADPRTGLIKSFGVQAYACHPLLAGDRIIGTLSFGARRRTRFAGDEVELMRAVADQVAVAMERIRAEEAVRDSESFYRQTLESIPGMVFTTRPDGYCDYQSQQWVDYTGVPMSEHVGDGWNRLLHPDDRARAFAAWQDAVAGRAPYDLEYRVRRHDGVYEWFKVIGRPIHDADGQIARWFGVAANIDALKHAEEAVRESERRRDELLSSERAARSEAERAGRMKDEFLATLSHELRTPLNAILGWSQMLRRGGLSAEDAGEALAVIENNARLQKQLIEDLLDMSRIVAGKLKLDAQPLDIAVVAREAVAMFRPDAEAKDLGLELDLDVTAGQVLGDPGRLKQVIGNLLSNAVKFTPAGGRIRVALRRRGRHATLAVTDTGIGIAREFVPQLFERFRQADASSTRKYRGLGLGLALVKQMTELHGGRVRARSPGPGEGATFVVRLPLISSLDLQLPLAAGSPLTSEVSLAGIAALVVEDEPTTLALLARVLKEAGAEVTTCTSAAEALRAMQARTYGVLISDISMPGEDGYALMRQIRRLPDAERASTPAIAVTAFSRSHDRSRAFEAGFQTYMTKPVEAAELCAAVANLARRTATAVVGRDAPSI